MKNRIRINGVLYESVQKDQGKFGQIDIDDDPKSPRLSILDDDYEYLWLKFKKKGTKDYSGDYSEYDVVTLSEYDDADYDEILVAEDSSKGVYDKVVKYILDADSKRDDPWDESSARRLIKDIKGKYDFISMDEEERHINSEWYNSALMNDDPWELLVNGQVTFDDIEGYLVGEPDEDYSPEDGGYYLPSHYTDSYYYRQGWMSKDGHIYSDAEMYI